LKKQLKKIGPIEHVILINKDRRGEVTCFAVFKEINILDRIDGIKLILEGTNSEVLFSQALSYKQLSF